jgi:hypothetical protein
VEGWKLPPFFVSLGMEKKIELATMLQKFQATLCTLESDETFADILEGLDDYLTDQIVELQERIAEEKMFEKINKGLGIQK